MKHPKGSKAEAAEINWASPFAIGYSFNLAKSKKIIFNPINLIHNIGIILRIKLYFLIKKV